MARLLRNSCVVSAASWTACNSTVDYSTGHLTWRWTGQHATVQRWYPSRRQHTPRHWQIHNQSYTTHWVSYTKRVVCFLKLHHGRLLQLHSTFHSNWWRKFPQWKNKPRFFFQNFRLSPTLMQGMDGGGTYSVYKATGSLVSGWTNDRKFSP